MTAHLAAMIASKGAMQAASAPDLCARGQAAAALGRDRKVRPGPRQSNSGPRAQVRIHRIMACIWSIVSDGSEVQLNGNC